MRLKGNFGTQFSWFELIWNIENSIEKVSSQNFNFEIFDSKVLLKDFWSESEILIARYSI